MESGEIRIRTGQDLGYSVAYQLKRQTAKIPATRAYLRYNGKLVSSIELLPLLMLAAKRDSTLNVRIEGENPEAMLRCIEQILCPNSCILEKSPLRQLKNQAEKHSPMNSKSSSKSSTGKIVRKT